MCTPETNDTPTDSNSTDDNGGGGTAVAASSSAAAAMAATELRWCSLRLPAAPAALPLRCLCLCLVPLCLWLRLWGTAAAAPLPVENREEEAPRAHLRAGTQLAQGSNPGRAVRESSLMPAAGEENFAPRLESSAKMTGSRTTFASRALAAKLPEHTRKIAVEVMLVGTRESVRGGAHTRRMVIPAA